MSPEPDPFDVLGSAGVRDATAATRVRGGWDTRLWRVERPGGACALRLFAPGEEAKRELEVAAMAAASSEGVPAPAVLASGTWNSRPFLLLEWCPGRTMAEAISRRPRRLWRLGLLAGAQQAKIHRVPAPERLRGRSWITWSGAPDEELRAALQHVSRGAQLLHLDYHPLNVMVDGRGVSCVLDWANACSGDPRADVARTVVILRLSPLPPGPRGRVEAVGRRLLELAWRRGYALVSPGIFCMAPFYAWAADATARDLAPKVGMPGVPLTGRDIDRLRAWSSHWRRRAGVS